MRKLTLEEVREGFAKEGCTLLATKYEGNQKKMPFICNCGATAEISWGNFMMGRRCKHCRYERTAQALRKEDTVQRPRPDNWQTKLWREAVYERDNYTCMKCGEKGGYLNAHHIVGFTQDESLKYDVSNGATLCQPCHTMFHRKYGYKRFSAEDFGVYIKKEE